jgi:hypothetical protein
MILHFKHTLFVISGHANTVYHCLQHPWMPCRTIFHNMVMCLFFRFVKCFLYFVGRVVAYGVISWSKKILLLLLQIVSPFAGRSCHVVKRLNIVVN